MNRDEENSMFSGLSGVNNYSGLSSRAATISNHEAAIGSIISNINVGAPIAGSEVFRIGDISLSSGVDYNMNDLITVIDEIDSYINELLDLIEEVERQIAENEERIAANNKRIADNNAQNVPEYVSSTDEDGEKKSDRNPAYDAIQAENSRLADENSKLTADNEELKKRLLELQNVLEKAVKSYTQIQNIASMTIANDETLLALYGGSGLIGRGASNLLNRLSGLGNDDRWNFGPGIVVNDLIRGLIEIIERNEKLIQDKKAQIARNNRKIAHNNQVPQYITHRNANGEIVREPNPKYAEAQAENERLRRENSVLEREVAALEAENESCYAKINAECNRQEIENEKKDIEAIKKKIAENNKIPKYIDGEINPEWEKGQRENEELKKTIADIEHEIKYHKIEKEANEQMARDYEKIAANNQKIAENNNVPAYIESTDENGNTVMKPNPDYDRAQAENKKLQEENEILQKHIDKIEDETEKKIREEENLPEPGEE